MPEIGNKLGERAWYQYTDDTGENYSVQLDSTNAEVMGFELNDENPNLPRRFTMRGVYAENSDGARKFLPAPTADSDVYSSNISVTLAIDTEEFKTTGRKGEKVSYARNKTEAAPPPPDPAP